MLDSIFVLIFVVAFVTTILGYQEKSIVYSILSLMIWIVIMVQSLWITDIAGNVYNEYGLSAICLAFIFINIILLIVYFVDWKHEVNIP